MGGKAGRPSAGLRLLAAFVLVTTGCGTMLKSSDFVAAEGTKRTVISNGSVGGGPTPAGPTSTLPGQAPVGGTKGTQGTQGTQVPNGTADPGGTSSNAPSGPNQASDVGVTESAIKIGNITAVNGALGPDAFTPLLRGIKLYTQNLNDQGGVNGRKLELQTCDDAEDPNQDRVCGQKLVESSGVFAMVSSGATDTYLTGNYLSSKGVPDIGYPIGNAYYKYPTMFAIIGSKGYPRDGSTVGLGGNLYAQTAEYRYFKQQSGVSAAAVIFYSIAISQQAGRFIATSLQTEGIPVKYEPNGGQGIIPTQQSYDGDVIAMRNAGVDGIWNAIDVAGFQKLCLAMDRNSFTVKANVSTVQGWSQKVGRDFSSPCRNNIYARGFSVPYSVTSDPHIAEIVQAANRYDPSGYLHQWNVDGWAGGKLFTDAVASMGPAPTRKGVIDYIDNLRDYTYGGLFVPTDWRPSTDFSVPDQECYSLGQWSDSAGTFVSSLSDTLHCEVSAYFSYQPNDDGS